MIMEKLMGMLENFINETPEIQGIIIATTDGFPVAHVGKGDPEKLSAIVASLSSLARRSTNMVDLGNPEEMFISTSEGKIVIYDIEDIAVMGVIALRNVSTGMVLVNIRKILPLVNRMLGERYENERL